MICTTDTNLLEEKQCLNDMVSLVNLLCNGAVNATNILNNAFDLMLAIDDLVTNG